jgi:hypothetical protein
MPSYTANVLRDQLAFVRVNSAPLYYGFKTKDFSALPGITGADITALGHLSSGSVPANSFKVIGANSPKPLRAKKRINANPSAAEQGSVSTFVADNAVATAETAGWSIVGNGRGVTLRNDSRAITVGIELTGGQIYLETKNASDVNAYAGELGLQLPGTISAAELRRGIMGATRPRPPRVQKKRPGGGTVTMPVDPIGLDDALAAGWSLVSPEVVYGAAPVTP